MYLSMYVHEGCDEHGNHTALVRLHLKHRTLYHRHTHTHTGQQKKTRNGHLGCLSFVGLDFIPEFGLLYILTRSPAFL